MVTGRVTNRRSWSAFKRDRRGNVAMMWALMGTVLIGLIGLTVDFTRAQMIRSQLQNAADGAVLAAARAPGNVSLADRTALATSYFQAEAGSLATGSTLSLSPVGTNGYRVDVSAPMEIGLARLINNTPWNVAVDLSTIPTNWVMTTSPTLQRTLATLQPQDVYINHLFGGLSQLDHGVTTVFDVSQIHHSPAHSDAAIKALFDTGRRAVFGYFESAGAAVIGSNPGNQYPTDATRIRNRWFASNDQLVTMMMGGEIYLPGYEAAWKIGRQLGLPIAAHILSPFGMRPTFDALAAGTGGDSGTLGIGADNLFIHMTGMSDAAWTKVKDVGASVSLAVPIEMNMRHGTPPILKMQSLGMEPSLSVDVECTMTADFFTQMRGMMTMQRMVVNQMVLDQGNFAPPNQWPTPTPDKPKLLNTRDVLRYATVNGARDLRLGGKTGSLTPGKEADILILDATALNVAPLNHVPGAVVSLMDRGNVETVLVAGKVRKWKGRLVGVNLERLRRQLEDSRDYLFAAANIPQDLFGPN